MKKFSNNLSALLSIFYNNKILKRPNFSEKNLFLQGQLMAETMNKKEKELIQKNFKIFGPNFLAAHFFGDIVKEKPKLMNKFKSFYNLSYKLKLTSVTRKTFYRQVKMIIDTEQKREKHNFYLI